MQNKVMIIPVINLSDDFQNGIKIIITHPAKAIVLHSLKIFSGDIRIYFAGDFDGLNNALFSVKKFKFRKH